MRACFHLGEAKLDYKYFLQEGKTMRKDPYNESEPTRRTKRASRPTAEPKKRNPAARNFFGDNPPVRIEITYRNGDKDILKGEQIDSDNPILAALGNVRTCRRFWTDPKAPANEQSWSTDEELLDFAATVSLVLTGASDAERAAQAGAKMGLKAKYFLTGEDGEPLWGDDGNWIPANPIDRGTYAPGTHVPAT